MIAPPPVPASAAPLAASVHVAVAGTHGRPPFAVVGERLQVAGTVSPYVPGQTVRVIVYRDGHRVASRRVALVPATASAGRFRVFYSSSSHGLITIRVAHAASDQMAAFAASPINVRYFAAKLALGSRGPAVRVLQRELAALHYAVPIGGYFDEATARAVIAYRKVTRMARFATVDARIFGLLQYGVGAFRARYSRQGNHIEADLRRQVLVEVQAHGHVLRIYTMSSGKPSTPTVLGRFRVYEKAPGTNSEGMVDSNYFTGGYAIHGYAEVPVYAASHGCLRIPIPDAPAVYAWIKLGYPVDVYG